MVPASTWPTARWLQADTTAADLAGYQRLFAFGQAQVPVGAAGRSRVRQLRRWADRLAAGLRRVGGRGRAAKRPSRRTGAKSDALDALRAAREALACDHPVAPRRRGDREALRVLLATRHSACVAKVGATKLKALIVGAPEELRAELRGLGTKRQIARCARLRDRPGRWSIA